MGSRHAAINSMLCLPPDIYSQVSHIYNHCVGPIIIFVTIDRAAGGNAHDTRGKVVNLATLDVKSMLVPNYSAGCGGKVLKLAKYAALRAHLS